MQVDVREPHAQQGHRLAGLDRPFVELLDRHLAHRARALHRVEQRGPFIPPRRGGDRAFGPGVLVGDEPDVAGDAVLHDPVESCRFRARIRIPRVAEPDGERVPRPRHGGVRLREVEVAARVHRDQRHGVVHHRAAPLRRRDIVVREAERVADLMRRVLPATRHREVLGAHVQSIGTGGGKEARVDVVVDQRTPRVHADHRTEDLAGARIGERRPDGRAGTVTVHPVQHRVARVHGIRARREIAHEERVPESGAFEHLAPPHPTFAERGLVRLGNAGVEIVDDRRHGFRELTALIRRGILGDEPPAVREAVAIRAFEALRVVVEPRAAVAGAGVVLPRAESLRGRERDERVMHLEHRRGSVRGIAAQQGTGVVHVEREHRVDLRVQRERPGARSVDPTARRVDARAALLGAADGLADAVGISEEEARGVHDEHAIGLGLDREGCEHGARRGLSGGPLSGGIRGRCPHAPVVAQHQNAFALPLEPHHRAAAGLPAVQTDGCTGPGGEDGLMQEVLAEPLRRDLKQHLVAVRIHAHTEEARLLGGRDDGRRGEEQRSGSGSRGPAA